MAITITVEYFGQLQRLTGERVETLEIAPNTTIPGLLNELAARYGERFRDFLFTPEGRLRPSIPIIMDDYQLREEQYGALHDGARLLILSPVAGG